MIRRLWIVAVWLLWASSALASTFYVATASSTPPGNDNNPGTKEAPFLTIVKCWQVAHADDTCLIHGGGYKESIGGFGNPTGNRSNPGSSWQHPVIFSGVAGETAIVSGKNDGQDIFEIFCGTDGGTPCYQWWKNIIVDGTGMTRGGGFTIGPCVRLENLEIRFTAGSGIHTAGSCPDELLNLNVHHTGTAGRDPVFGTQPHGVYDSARGTRIIGGSYHDNWGYCVHSFESGGSGVSDTFVDGIRCYNNSLAKTGNPLLGNDCGCGGFYFGNGTNKIVRNSLFYHNAIAGVQINGTALLPKVEFNSFFDNWTGLLLNPGTTAVLAEGNISFGNPGNNIYDYGTGNVFKNNMTTDPHWTAPEAGNFTLKGR